MLLGTAIESFQRRQDRQVITKPGKFYLAARGGSYYPLARILRDVVEQRRGFLKDYRPMPSLQSLNLKKM
jgi:hypothetical protein